MECEVADERGALSAIFGDDFSVEEQTYTLKTAYSKKVTTSITFKLPKDYPHSHPVVSFDEVLGEDGAEFVASSISLSAFCGRVSVYDIYTEIVEAIRKWKKKSKPVKCAKDPTLIVASLSNKILEERRKKNETEKAERVKENEERAGRNREWLERERKSEMAYFAEPSKRYMKKLRKREKLHHDEIMKIVERKRQEDEAARKKWEMRKKKEDARRAHIEICKRFERRKAEGEFGAMESVRFLKRRLEIAVGEEAEVVRTKLALAREHLTAIRKENNRIFEDEIAELNKLESEIERDEFSEMVLGTGSYLSVVYVNINDAEHWTGSFTEILRRWPRNLYISRVETVLQTRNIVEFGKKKLLYEREFKGGVKVMYHGTSTWSTEGIVMENFSVPGEGGVRMKNGARFGRGIYMARSPRLAENYTSGSNMIIVCCVLPGLSYDCDYGPLREHVPGYDSNVGDDSRQMVLFESSQVLPCYVFHYKKVHPEESLRDEMNTTEACGFMYGGSKAIERAPHDDDDEMESNFFDPTIFSVHSHYRGVYSHHCS